MTRSTVGPAPSRHASLALDAYVQVCEGGWLMCSGALFRVCFVCWGGCLDGVRPSESSAQTNIIKQTILQRHKTTHPPTHSRTQPNQPNQVTSPIRRYPDMLAHWNIKAALRGDAPPFSAAALQSIADAGAEAGRALGRAEGEVQKYWVAEFMRQRAAAAAAADGGGGDDASFEATVLGAIRPDAPLFALLLEQPGLETVARLPWDARPGERCLVSPVSADPFGLTYRLGVIGEIDSPARRAREAAEAAAAAASGGGSGSDSEDDEEEDGGSGGGSVGGSGGSGDDVDMEAVWALVDAAQQREGGDDEEEEEAQASSAA